MSVRVGVLAVGSSALIMADSIRAPSRGRQHARDLRLEQVLGTFVYASREHYIHQSR